MSAKARTIVTTQLGQTIPVNYEALLNPVMPAAVVYTNFGGMLVHENRGGVETEYVNDTLGSLVECRDTSGTKTYDAVYWPYGEIRTSTGTNPSPWAFVGLFGYLRESSARTYVRARYYRQELARWMSVDPLWPRQSPFRYGNNNPANELDPSGRFAFVPVACAVACGGCLICLAGFLSACSYCGDDTSCWYECLSTVLDELPSWAKWLCGAACAGCLLCVGRWLIRTRPKPSSPPPLRIERCNPKAPRSTPRQCFAVCMTLWTFSVCAGRPDFNACVERGAFECRAICGMPPWPFGGGGGGPGTPKNVPMQEAA